MTTYVEDSDGKFIPASQRPDGTWRKARRVKDGYVPQEEVPLYESKGKLFAKKPASSLPPGMCAQVVAASKQRQQVKKNDNPATRPPSQPAVTPGNTNSKSSKTKQKEEKKASKPSSSQPSSTAATGAIAKTPTEATSLMEGLSLNAEEDPDKVNKMLKKLRKKVREIENIEAKIKSGEIKSPDKDQVEKVGRKKQIVKEIEKLESLTGGGGAPT